MGRDGETLPGERLTASQAATVINELRDIILQGKSPIEAMEGWTRISKTRLLDDLSRFLGPFHVFYDHPVVPGRRQVTQASPENVKSYVDSRVHPEYGEGVDVTIASMDRTLVVVINHDGDIWAVAEPSRRSTE